MLGAPHTPEVPVHCFETVSLRWRADARLFHLGADKEGEPTLTLDDGRQLVLTAEQWRVLGDVLFQVNLQPPTPSESDLPVPARPGRRGMSWTEEDEAALVAAFDRGEKIGAIAKELGRSRGAVAARLVRLGKLDEAEAGLRWPLSTD